MFDKIINYLTTKSNYDYQLDTNADIEFLNFLNQVKTDSELLKQIADYEMTANGKPSVPLRKLLFSSDFAYRPNNTRLKWQDFDAYISVVKAMIPLLPAQALDLEITYRDHAFWGKYTLLSEAMTYLINLYYDNRRNKFANYEEYQAIQSRWKSEIIDSL